jgi:hypothetical protein
MIDCNEHTWMGPVTGNELKRVMKTFIDYHPRKRQADSCTGTISLSGLENFEWLRDQLKKDGVNITISAGN